MADNFVANPGAGGDTFASDEIDGVQFPRSKVGFGIEGEYVDVSSTDPLPVAGAVTIATLPLPADAATETTLSAVNTKLPTKQTGIASPADEYMPVSPIPAHQLRIGFDKVISGGVDTAQMTVIQAGSGQTINQTSGSLVVTTGTTANAETIVRSVETVEASIVERWSVLLSQRIANQNFYIELVDVIGDSLAYTLNSSTSMTVTIPNNPFTSQNVGQGMWISADTAITAASQRAVIASVSGNNVTYTGSGWPASGSGFCDVFGWNYIQAHYTGTTATSVNIDAQRNGWATGATAATINTTASTHIGVFASSDAEMVFMDQTNTSATGLELTQRASRVRNVPDSNIPLYLQIRVLNGTTAPASTTTLTVGFVDIQHTSTQPVSIQNLAPMSANSGIPVNLVGSITQAVTVSSLPATPAGTNTIGGTLDTPTTAAAQGMTPVATTVAASNVVLKAAAGNLYSLNYTVGASAGYIMVFNATSAPADGTVTPLKVIPVAANAGNFISFSPPVRCSTGCTVVFSTTGPFTKTASATAFISGECV